MNFYKQIYACSALKMDGPKGRRHIVGADTLRDAPSPLQKTVKPIKRNLKHGLAGPAPFHSREFVLQLCPDIMEEDYDADGPRTESAGDRSEPKTKAVVANPTMGTSRGAAS